MSFPRLSSSENSKSTQTDRSSSSTPSHRLDLQEQQLLLEIDELRRTKVDQQQQLDSSLETIERCLKMTRSLLIDKSILEKKQIRQKAMENRLRLGQFVTQRQGTSFVEQWIDGYDFLDKQRAQEQLARAKETLDRERKSLTKKKTVLQQMLDENKRTTSSNKSLRIFSENSNEGPTDSSNSSSSSSSSTLFTLQDWYEYDEVLRLRQLTLKREEADLVDDLERLDRERNVHIRELKRLYNEDHSRFNQNTILHERYLLFTLIGKGGFSEVHRAFDLREQRYVACKIHQLNKEWKDEKKVNYIKHALREYNIHKHLEHKRIVKLFDVFEIDTNSFCTVLEYCDGNDLDFFLKQNKTIPEKEARSIIMQTINALKYLNVEIKPPVVKREARRRRSGGRESNVFRFIMI